MDLSNCFLKLLVRVDLRDAAVRKRLHFLFNAVWPELDAVALSRGFVGEELPFFIRSGLVISWAWRQLILAHLDQLNKSG